MKASSLGTIGTVLGVVGGLMHLGSSLLNDIETETDELSRAFDSEKLRDTPIDTKYYRVKSIDDRLKILAKLAIEYKLNNMVHRVATVLARVAANRYGERNQEAQASYIFTFMKHYVTYVSDALMVDTYQTPARTLTLRRGDCDDFSTTIAALAMNMGIPVAYKVIKVALGPDEIKRLIAAGKKPEPDWTHIYPLLAIQRKNGRRVWWPLDATVKHKPMGWEDTNRIVEWKVYDVNGKTLAQHKQS